MHHGKPRALITGITGQDGAYLARSLIKKGYRVHGLRRRSSSFNTARIDDLLHTSQTVETPLTLHYGDLTDSLSLLRLIEEIEPDEIYNLGAMSHVGVSFLQPEYVADVDGLGAARILEAARILGLQDKTRIYQASTSELYGDVAESPQSEDTLLRPQSPYAAAKLYAYWMTKIYREAYGMFASNGILFNHESAYRGETFLTRKVTRHVASIACGFKEPLVLGNLNAVRDWGHAREFVEAMWLILQHDKPDDFVIATGKTHSVREFVQKSFRNIGVSVEFEGKNVEERGIVTGIENSDINISVGDPIVVVSAQYFRPNEVEFLCGDASKAEKKLNWKPTTTLDELISEMVQADIFSYRNLQK